MSKPHWWPEWEGETCVIIASGPSAKYAPLEKGRGNAKFIAINTSWKLFPDADILFACDAKWWQVNKGCPDFKGLKLTVEERATKEFPDVHLVHCRKPDDRLFLEPLGTVGWGGNGGFHCLNLAVQFRCRKIILVGYDMHLRDGTHWHGDHPKGLSNPNVGNVKRWRKAVDNAADIISDLGITVINCNPHSALTRYPKMTFDLALEA